MRKSLIIFVILCMIILGTIMVFWRADVADKEAFNVMRHFGFEKKDDFRVYCSDEFDNMKLLEVVIDFYAGDVVINGKHYPISANSRSGQLFYDSEKITTLFTHEYSSVKGIPEMLAFSFLKDSREYTFIKLNSITKRILWEHKLVCQ